MMATLYGFLLGLHPPAFRERFAAEMTLNFEEAGPGRSGQLLFDGFVSLLRQWLVRSGWWKLGIAVAVACLQVIAISRDWHVHHGLSLLVHHSSSSVNEQQAIALIVLCATGFFVVLAMMITLWVRSLVNGRLKSTAGRRRVPGA